VPLLWAIATPLDTCFLGNTRGFNR